MCDSDLKSRKDRNVQTKTTIDMIMRRKACTQASTTSNVVWASGAACSCSSRGSPEKEGEYGEGRTDEEGGEELEGENGEGDEGTEKISEYAMQHADAR